MSTLVTDIRETARFAGGVAAFVVNGEPQALNNYLQACFAAGTPILGEHGAKPIEQFGVGDRVWARNEDDPDGPVELKVIEQLFQSASPIWHIHVGGQVIRTTAEHPFWVEGQGWTAAKELHIGDVLVSHDGQSRLVDDLLETGQWETVYNFRVADHHTYFVGRPDWGFSLWAHNSDLCLQVVRRRGMNAPNANIEVRNNAGNRLDVWGTPQAVRLQNGNFTDHANQVLAALPQIAQNAPAGSYIVLNRAWRTGTNRWFTSNLRPDIMLVEPLDNGRWKVSAWEVRSPSDPDDLQQRLEDGWDTFIGDPARIVKGILRVWGE